MSWNHLGNGRFDEDRVRFVATAVALIVALATGGGMDGASTIISFAHLLPQSGGRGPDRPAT